MTELIWRERKDWPPHDEEKGPFSVDGDIVLLAPSGERIYSKASEVFWSIIGTVIGGAPVIMAATIPPGSTARWADEAEAKPVPSPAIPTRLDLVEHILADASVSEALDCYVAQFEHGADVISAMLDALGRMGMAVVPVEPTPEMRQVVAAQWGRKTWAQFAEVIAAAQPGEEG